MCAAASRRDSTSVRTGVAMAPRTGSKRRSVDISQKIDGADIQSARELGEDPHAGITHGSLDAAHIGHVQPGALGERLLTHPALLPQPPHVRCDDRKGVGQHAAMLRQRCA